MGILRRVLKLIPAALRLFVGEGLHPAAAPLGLRWDRHVLTLVIDPKIGVGSQRSWAGHIIGP